MDNANSAARPAVAEAREHNICQRNLIMGLRERQQAKRIGMAAARQWRESRRCQRCGAMAFETCAHRPHGAHGEPTTAVVVEHMPFAGHRTCAQINAFAAPSIVCPTSGGAAILRNLGRD